MAKQQLKHLQDYEGKQIQGTRDYQEDDFGFDASHPKVLLALLADGMGGYAGGDTASGLVIRAFMDSYHPDDEQMTADRLSHSMATANKTLADKIVEKPELAGMGCTFVGAVLSNNFTRLHWISVGDSPFWLYRKGKLSRLNIDHSKRTELLEKVKKGEITAEEAATHPERNALMSALVGEPPSKIDNNSKALEPSDILLIASDGLLTLTEQEIERLLSHTNNSANELTNSLLGAINRKKRSGQDNTTVLIIKIPPPVTLEHAPVINESLKKKNTDREKINKKLNYLILGCLFLLSLVIAFIAGSEFSSDSQDKVLNKPKEPENIVKKKEIDNSKNENNTPVDDKKTNSDDEKNLSPIDEKTNSGDKKNSKLPDEKKEESVAKNLIDKEGSKLPPKKDKKIESQKKTEIDSQNLKKDKTAVNKEKEDMQDIF